MTYDNKLTNDPAKPVSYEHAVAQTDAFEAQMRDEEDRKTPEGRERIRLRVEASKREIANRDQSYK